jgi:type I restriction enzyme S subunit
MSRELPPGWVEAKLGEIADIRSGITLGKKRSAGQLLVEHPYLRVANVQRGHLDLSIVKKIVVTDKEANELRLQVGDILMNEGGDRDKLGRGWIWEGQIPACIHQNHVFRVRLVDKGIQPKLVSFYANEVGREFFALEGKQSVNLASINQRMVAQLPVPIPPLPEQRRIVERIEALLAKGARAEAALAAIPDLLDRYRRSLLAAAFRGDLTADVRKNSPSASSYWAEKLGEQSTPGNTILAAEAEDYFNRSVFDLGMSSAADPEWYWSELQQICDNDRGITYGIVQTGENVQNGIPTVRCGDIRGFSISRNLKKVTMEIESKYKRTRLRGGEVLIAIRGTVGAVSVVPSDFRDFNISREVAMAPVLPGIDGLFVAYWLGSPFGQYQLSIQAKGVAQSGINLSDVRRLMVPLPHPIEKKAIIGVVRDGLERITRLEAAVAAARGRHADLTRSILAKAFRGELVPQDPSDEPASVLLERIRAERGGQPQARRRGRRPRGEAV